MPSVGAQAEQHAAQHVAALVVGAEQVACGSARRRSGRGAGACCWCRDRTARSSGAKIAASTTTKQEERGGRRRRIAQDAPPHRVLAPDRGDGALVGFALQRQGGVGHRARDPRIEIGVEHVDGQVDRHEADGEDQDRALRQREVARGDGADRHAADARPGEHGLGDDRAAEQEADLQADQRDDRDHRVAQRVTDGDAPVRGALGARRAHIVGAQRFEQRRARHARHRSDEHRAQGDRGQDDAGQPAARPDRAVAALEGQQALPPTYWISSRPTQNTGTDTPITDSAMMMRSIRGRADTRRHRAERDAERHRPDQAGQHQLGRGADGRD